MATATKPGVVAADVAAHETKPTARTELEIAAAARLVQLAIRARLMRDVSALWPALDAKRLGDTFPGWLRAMTLLIRNYHGQSASAAATAYREARSLATHSPAPRSLIIRAAEPDPAWMRKAFGFSGPGLIEKDTAKPGTALSTTLGVSSRIALDGGRTTTLQTLAADPVAVGWYRVTDGRPCAFCALLASRGVTYKEHAFDKSNAKFTGGGEFKVHNDCGCSLAPAFDHSTELPDISKAALEAYINRPGGAALPAFRKAWADYLASLDTPASSPS